MKKDILKGFVKIVDRKIMKQGSSLGVTVPKNLLKMAKCKKGDIVPLYSDGKGLIVIDLLPDME